MTGLAFFADVDRWNHMDGWSGGWMWLWGVAMMILVGFFIVWLVRANATPAASAPRDPIDRAREILAERYAKGELTTDEYRERTSELK